MAVGARRLVALVAAVFVVAGIVLATVSVGAAPADKVTYCHADRNANQPYGPKALTTSENAAKKGHAGHTGPLVTSIAQAFTIKAQGGSWGDIIPPIPGLPNGLNWPAGAVDRRTTTVSSRPPPSRPRPVDDVRSTSRGKVTICHRDNNAKQPYGPKPITLAERAR